MPSSKYSMAEIEKSNSEREMSMYKSSILSIMFLLPVLLILAVDSQAIPRCESRCGAVDISYPFGIGKLRCAQDASFFIDCRSNGVSGNTPRPFYNDMEIIDLDLHRGKVTVLHEISQSCYNTSAGKHHDTIFPLDLTKTPFTFSTSNKFTVTGCATVGVMTNSSGDRIDTTVPCTLLCIDLDIPDGTCSGIGCCQTSIVEGLKFFNVSLITYYATSGVESLNSCSYAFLVEEYEFKFTRSILKQDDNFTRKKPVVLQFSVEKCGTGSSSIASSSGLGYLCKCPDGYDGNPYIDNGCKVFKDGGKCIQGTPTGICRDTPGSFHGFYPQGMEGGACITCGCNTKSKLIVGLGGGLISLLFTSASFLIYKRNKKLWKNKLEERYAEQQNKLKETYEQLNKHKERYAEQQNKHKERYAEQQNKLEKAYAEQQKKIKEKEAYVEQKKKLKETYVKQNKELLLNQQMSSQELVDTMKKFTLKELKIATYKFDSSRILEDGRHRTVYKGLLLDQRVVAIKKSKITNKMEIEQLMNEVALFSQIDHRNVVRLLGCCLENEVPLLVYEFIGNGTLSDHLHIPIHDFHLNWDDRLRIATEVAGTIAYFHSAGSLPISHGDLNSSNILLDEKLIAKIADFGASKSIMSDETRITTAVHIDPEYHRTGKLTDKSDVYSMGVLLVELLTGQRNLVKDFISLHGKDNLFTIFVDTIVEEATKSELESVAKLAMSCLNEKGVERTTMKEVATTLQGLRGCREKILSSPSLVSPGEKILSWLASNTWLVPKIIEVLELSVPMAKPLCIILKSVHSFVKKQKRLANHNEATGGG